MLRANNGNVLKRRQAGGSSSRTVVIIVAHPVEYILLHHFAAAVGMPPLFLPTSALISLHIFWYCCNFYWQRID